MTQLIELWDNEGVKTLIQGTYNQELPPNAESMDEDEATSLMYAIRNHCHVVLRLFHKCTSDAAAELLLREAIKHAVVQIAFDWRNLESAFNTIDGRTWNTSVENPNGDMESDFQGTKSWNIQEIRTAAAVLQDRYKAVFKELSSELYGIVIGGF